MEDQERAAVPQTSNDNVIIQECTDLKTANDDGSQGSSVQLNHDRPVKNHQPDGSPVICKSNVHQPDTKMSVSSQDAMDSSEERTVLDPENCNKSAAETNNSRSETKDELKSLGHVPSANHGDLDTEIKPFLEQKPDIHHDSAKTEETKIVDPDNAPDGGYGWVVVVCALLVFMMYGANWISFSIYITDFSEVFDKPQAYIGIIGSVDAAFSQFTALPSGAFVSLYGCRAVCMTGLLVFAIGTFLSAFTDNFYLLLITFGVIKGIGAGMIYIPCNMIVQQYFTRRRALAVAFSSAGLSFGTMCYSPIHRILIQSYGWRGGLIFFSGIVIQSLLFAALMRPPDFKRKIQRKVEQEKLTHVGSSGDCSTQTCSESCGKTSQMIFVHLSKALTLSYLKDAKFVLFISIRTFGMCGIIAMYKFSVARAVYMGVDKLSASFLVTCIGICSSSFRYIGGVVANFERVNRLVLYSTCNCVGGTIVMLSMMANSQLYSHVIFHLMFGAMLGMSECVHATIASDLFGIQRLPSTLGWTMAFTGLMALGYMPLFGWLYDITNSYTVPYLLGGSIQVLAGSCGYIILLIKRHEAKHGQQGEPEPHIIVDHEIEKKAEHEETNDVCEC